MIEEKFNEQPNEGSNPVLNLADLDTPNELSKEDAAVFWLQRDYKPLRLGNPGTKFEKAPPYSKWQEKALKTEEEARAAFQAYPESNIGLMADTDIVFIDVDVKDGKDGIADLEEAQEVWGELPQTPWRNMTAHGGFQLPFRVDPEVGKNLKATVNLELRGRKMAIDIRVGNSQGVAAPSVLGDGGRYRVDGKVCRKEELPFLTDGWIRAIPKRDEPLVSTPEVNVPAVDTSNPLIVQDLEDEETTADIDNMAQAWMEDKENKKILKLEADPVVARRAVRYTFKNIVHHPAVSGQFGHGDMIRVCSHLGWGLDLAPALRDKLIHEYNDHCDPPFDDAELAHKIHDAINGVGALVEKGFFRNKRIKNGVVLELTKHGGTSAGPTNLLTIFMNDPVLNNLKKNLQTERLECDGPVVINMNGIDVTFNGRYDDKLRAAIIHHLDSKYGISPSDKDFDTALINLSNVRTFFPFETYIKSLTWDGVHRLDTLMEVLFEAEPNAVNKWAPRMVFRGIFARQFKRNTRSPGDWIHLLSGHQGNGKTEYFQRIFTPRGYSWVAVMTVDDLTTPEKLVYKAEGILLALCDEWVINRATQEALKSSLSQTSIPFRRVYAHEPEVFVKRFMHAGTTNEDAFLSDPTGSRRYLITKVGLPENHSKVHDILTPEMVDQIWAEAYQDFLANGDKSDFLRLPREVEIEAAIISETARLTDPWEPIITAYADAMVNGNSYYYKGQSEDGDSILVQPHYQRDSLTAAEIYSHAFRKLSDIDEKKNNPVKMTKKESARIGSIMDSLPSWKRGKVYYDNTRTSGFVRVDTPIYSIPKSKIESWQLDSIKRGLQYNQEMTLHLNSTIIANGTRIG